MKKIFLVEDDKAICEELEMLLKNSGYETDKIKDFQNSKNEIIQSHPDLILMDINIPGINGQMLLSELRKEMDTPIIMLTSKATEIDEVLSMSYGADDYITKPYNPTILLLRIAAIFKRVDNVTSSLTYRDLTVNTAKGILLKGSEELLLTKNEMIIFRYLLSKINTIVSRDDLMNELWNNDEYVNDNALTVNISRLRSKLADFGYEDVIETRKKQGYILL